MARHCHLRRNRSAAAPVRLGRLRRGAQVQIWALPDDPGDGHGVADSACRCVGRYDRVTQRVDKCHVRIGEHSTTRDTLALPYVWPSELDLIAHLAWVWAPATRGQPVGWPQASFVDGR